MDADVVEDRVLQQFPGAESEEGIELKHVDKELPKVLISVWDLLHVVERFVCNDLAHAINIVECILGLDETHVGYLKLAESVEDQSHLVILVCKVFLLKRMLRN